LQGQFVTIRNSSVIYFAKRMQQKTGICDEWLPEIEIFWL